MTKPEQQRALELLSNIVLNARFQRDRTMGGFTDVYGVPLDDIEKARMFLDRIKERKGK